MTGFVTAYLVLGVLINTFGAFHFMRRGHVRSAAYWCAGAIAAGAALLAHLSSAEVWR
jgi:hypothetical protein